jgi:hypothetical protein
MFANHEKLAASNRHQSRERTESQEALRRPTFDIRSQRSKTTTGTSSTFFTPRWVRLWE